MVDTVTCTVLQYMERLIIREKKNRNKFPITMLLCYRVVKCKNIIRVCIFYNYVLFCVSLLSVLVTAYINIYLIAMNESTFVNSVINKYVCIVVLSIIFFFHQINENLSCKNKGLFTMQYFFIEGYPSKKLI